LTKLVTTPTVALSSAGLNGFGIEDSVLPWPCALSRKPRCEASLAPICAAAKRRPSTVNAWEAVMYARTNAVSSVTPRPTLAEENSPAAYLNFRPFGVSAPRTPLSVL